MIEIQTIKIFNSKITNLNVHDFKIKWIVLQIAVAFFPIFVMAHFYIFSVTKSNEERLGRDSTSEHSAAMP